MQKESVQPPVTSFIAFPLQAPAQVWGKMNFLPQGSHFSRAVVTWVMRPRGMTEPQLGTVQRLALGNP